MSDLLGFIRKSSEKKPENPDKKEMARSDAKETVKTGICKPEDSDSRDKISENVKERIFKKLIEYFLRQKTDLMSRLSDDDFNSDIKEEIKKAAIEKLRTMCMGDEALVMELYERFSKYLFGMYILEPLIEDDEIFDITVYSSNRIRAQRLGKWEDGGVSFSDSDDYERFISIICTRNRKNISIKNSQTTFTDLNNNKDFILRCNISHGTLNASGNTEFHIRKIPKNKFSVDQLVERAYMSQKQRDFICQKVKEGKNFLFSGANGSGKTFGVNALLEEIPPGLSGLIIQENDELFTKNPDFLVQHVMENTGEGKINYGLKELAKMGLMDARAIFVLGEVKSGSDAASLPMITSTGSQFIMTGHGNSAKDAVFKIADYMKQETGYSFDQCLRFLTNMIVVYCKRFKVEGIAYVKDWDREKERLIIEDVVFEEEDAEEFSKTRAYGDKEKIFDLKAHRKDKKTEDESDFFESCFISKEAEG